MSSSLSVNVLKQCSPELQAEFRSENISEEQLVQRMRDFEKYAKEDALDERGFPTSPDAPYGLSKIGVTIMSRIHANWLKEHGKQDILLNCCCPGWVHTDMGGPRAPKTPDEGAQTPIRLASLEEGTNSPHGEFLIEETLHHWWDTSKSL